MKKLFSLLLVLVLLFSLAACGTKDDTPAEEPGTETPEEPAEEP